jgi:Protein-L-isoaspartate(D-aspartate) O-methyltransferase (PCMT)
MSLLTSEEDRSSEAKSFAVRRKEMVERNIASRGVRDELVLEAMRKVPRELFLPKNLREFAYEDTPLPIAGEQTISQPYIVAFMAEALTLKGGEESSRDRRRFRLRRRGAVRDRCQCLYGRTPWPTCGQGRRDAGGPRLR